MSGWRKCAFGCRGAVMFKFPNDEATRRKWSEFVFGEISPRNAFVCARHFTDNCFMNKELYESGRITRLSLRHDAVPTIKDVPLVKPEWLLPEEPVVIPEKRSVATQLSAGTLRYHRSKGVQATEKNISRDMRTERPREPHANVKATVNAAVNATVNATVNAGVNANVKATVNAAVNATVNAGVNAAVDHKEESPAKRPRVKEEEEEQQILLPFPRDFMYEPRDSDASDQSDLESDEGDAKYIVSESSLRQLFERCPICTKHCEVRRRKRGLLVSFSQTCPHCSYRRRWQSHMEELLEVPVPEDHGEDHGEHPQSDCESPSKDHVLNAHMFISQQGSYLSQGRAERDAKGHSP
ncbi:uncharacterized protein [Eucyclogobius newberryi]|uniref:uncharacterized protein n=1 Tax=Eucyclogobius newberryi TaxID=166745 RepID=UPI003B593C30